MHRGEPLRVFHLIKSLGRGGAEMLLAEGLKSADRARFTYGYGYFLPWKDAMVSSLEAQHVEVKCFEARTNAHILLAARRVAAHLREWKADVLHCHMPLAGSVGRVAGRLAGVPVVYTEHNKMERFHPWTRRLSLASWRWQERVIAVSADVADSIRLHADSRVPVQVVLNGVAVDEFRRSDGDGAAVRRQYGIPLDAPVVGTVAVFRVQKRLYDWLEAARLLRERNPSVHFLLVGDGPLGDELKSAASRMNLDACVHFAGLQTAVRPYMSAMDVYMMSSQFEGLPVALLEAMAMECAVVCTAVGGIPEAVQHARNGHLVPPAAPAELAASAQILIADPHLRRQLGSAARKTVQDRFSMTRMTRELESIYLDVAGRRSHAS